MKTLPAFMVSAAAFAISAAPLSAAVYFGSAYEPFDYAPGTLAGQNGGSGFNASGDGSAANTSSWTASAAGASVTAGSLTYGGLYPASEGNKGSLVSSGSNADFRRPLEQTVNEGSFYFSYLTRRTAATERTVNVAFFTAATGGSEVFAIGQFGTGTYAAGDNRFQVSPHNTGSNYLAPASAIEYGLNQVHLVIGRLDFDVAGGATDRLTIWVDPTDGDLLNAWANGIDALTPYLTVDFDGSAGFGNISGIAAFRPFVGGTVTGHTAAAADFDEFRFGSTFQQVVPIPEPGSTLLGLLGVCGFIGRRRR